MSQASQAAMRMLGGLRLGDNGIRFEVDGMLHCGESGTAVHTGNHDRAYLSRARDRISTNRVALSC
jgi:hypothetical protein